MRSKKGKEANGADPVTIGTRSEDITVSDQGKSGEVVVSVEPLGRDDLLIGVHSGDIEVHALTAPQAPS